MIKTKLLIFYLALFSLLFIPQAFAVNEICDDGTNNCCSEGPNCPVGEYWNGDICAPYVACAANEDFYCRTGACIPDTNYCATAADDPAMAGVCCGDGQILIVNDATGGWSCTTPGAGSSLWTLGTSGNDISYNGLVGVNLAQDQVDHALHVNGVVCVDDDDNCTAPGLASGDLYATGRITVGTDTPDSETKLTVFDNTPSSAETRSIYTHRNNTADHDTFGINSFVFNSSGGTSDVYGLYGQARNASASNWAYGLYGLGHYASGNSVGVYGTGDTYAGWFETLAGAVANSITLLVEQQNDNSTGAYISCAPGTAGCLPLRVDGGDDVVVTNANSGDLIIGDPNGPHMAIDGNEITTKSTDITGTAPLYFNWGAGPVWTNTDGIAAATDLCISVGTGGFLRPCASSLKYKKNIIPLADYGVGLEEILRLNPVKFTWKNEDAKPGSDEDMGLIAEEVEEVFPELVIKDEKGEILSVNYRHLTGPIIQAIKDQQAIIESQTQTIDSLTTSLEALTQRVEALESSR